MSSEVTLLTELTDLADGDELLVTDVSDTTTDPHSARGSSKRVTVANAAPAFLRGIGYVKPSGDTTGATDTAAINAIISVGGSACVLAAAGSTDTGGTPFYVNAPLTPATGSSLRGAMPWSAVDADAYGAGTGHSGGSVIHAVSGFTGAAVIDMHNTTATQMFGVSLADFTLECWDLPDGGGIHGIRVHGAYGACFLQGVCVNLPDGDCLHFEADATQSVGPDDWYVARCKFSASRSGSGVNADNLPDSWFSDCESSENALDNWLLSFSLNTRLANCKGENSSGGAGFRFGGQGGSGRIMQLIGCSTHLNNKDGFLFDDSASAGGTATGGIYRLVGCVAVSDGQAGGTTFAGFRSAGSKSTVKAVGCDASGAPFGASQTGTTGGLTFTGGSSLSGTSANVHDDGSGTNRLVNGGTDTSGTATASTPTFTSTTAKQLSTAQDVMLYIFCKTAVTSTTTALGIGATSAASTAVVPSASMSIPVGAMWSVRVPKGWFVKFTGTVADFTFTQVTC